MSIFQKDLLILYGNQWHHLKKLWESIRDPWGYFPGMAINELKWRHSVGRVEIPTFSYPVKKTNDDPTHFFIQGILYLQIASNIHKIFPY